MYVCTTGDLNDIRGFEVFAYDVGGDLIKCQIYNFSGASWTVDDYNVSHLNKFYFLNRYVLTSISQEPLGKTCTCPVQNFSIVLSETYPNFIKKMYRS